MEIEEVKTWQWVLAGLVVGFAFSCIVAWSGPTFDTQARDTIEQGEFENPTFALTKFGRLPPTLRYDLVHLYHVDKDKKILPLLKDVTVHPPSGGDPAHRYWWVTGRMYFVGLKRVDPTKRNSPEKVVEEWRPFKYPAKAPYVPGFTLVQQKKLPERANERRDLDELKTALGGQATYANVNEYLKAVAKLPDANFKFRYAWWELPRAVWTLPPIAGVLMIGIAWPLLLGILRRIGVAKPVPVKAVPAPVPEHKPVRAPSTAGVVLTPVAAKALPPVDTKEYGGEFYPVVKSTHKD